MSNEKIYIDNEDGSQIEIEKQESNMFLVDKLDIKTIRFYIKTMRKRHRIFGNDKIKIRATNNKELSGHSIKVSDFEENYQHPFEIKEDNNIMEMASLIYTFKGKIQGYVYLFEINNSK